MYRSDSHREQGQRYDGRQESVLQLFFEELARRGFVGGHNLVVERYSAEGRRDCYVELARAGVGSRVGVYYDGRKCSILVLTR